MNKVWTISFVLIVFISCKKDKLEGDKALLIGKWKWNYTESVWRPNCDSPSTTTILTPATEGKNYSIEFLKKGKVMYLENGEVFDKKRIVFTSFELVTYPPIYSQYYFFSIKQNNSDKYPLLSGYVKGDTLILKGSFPKGNVNEACISNTNYFLKEE